MMATRSSFGALPQDLPVRILDGSPDAVLIGDRAGVVRYWNAAAERVFGFSVTEALGASMNLIIPGRLRAPPLGRLGSGDDDGCPSLR